MRITKMPDACPDCMGGRTHIGSANDRLSPMPRAARVMACIGLAGVVLRF